ncbi:MAG TPA: hypothetical protein VFF32_00910 [Dermatophilaceae bacterium]|nr:hypothetical protein [Dermatophilaceae bacterium]
MSVSRRTSSPMPRARWAFWGLVAIAVLTAGSLTAGLGADPSPLTGLRVAASGLVLIGSLALAARVMVALERARRRARRLMM